MFEITIIVATNNSANTVAQMIHSIECQTYKKYELIIIDNNSTDDTLKIINKSKIKNIKIIQENDTGIYEAWNKGLKIASGHWIAFIGSDDLFLPNALEGYCNFIKKNNLHSCDIVSSKVILTNGEHSQRIIGKKWIWRKFKTIMTIGHVGCFHNRNFFIKYGYFDESFKICGDYEYLLRAKHKLKAGFMNEKTVLMSNDGISNSDIKSIYEAYLAKKKHRVKNIIFIYLDYQIARIKFIMRKYFTL